MQDKKTYTFAPLKTSTSTINLRKGCIKPYNPLRVMENTEKKDKTAGILSEFPGVSTTEWEAKITEDLKGADYEKKLIWKTAEGFSIKPYYRAEDLEGLKDQMNSLPGVFPFLRGTNTEKNDWEICQSIETPDPVTANAQAIDAVTRGATALSLNAQNLTGSAEVTKMLKGVNAGENSLHFNSSRSYIQFMGWLEEGLKSTGTDVKKVRGSVDFDPISYLLLKGNFHYSQEEDLLEAVDLIDLAEKDMPGFRVITVNGQYFHNSGSTLVQELAFALASGNDYLAFLTGKGLSIDQAASRIVFAFTTGSNYFPEIAKLRAARMLWARIVEQYKPANPESAKMHIHATTANWNKTIYDPYVNLLRTTTEAMSAAIGGADLITVLPFDLDYKEPDDFSLRIARNQQIILKEESSLEKVVDPAAGSYYIESLTAAFADAAWKLFLEVEEKGGMIEAIKTGFVQDRVNESAKQRRAEIASRKTIVLGTNQYPNTSENVLQRIQVEEEAGETEETEIPGLTPKYLTISIFRGTDDFEDLRLATEIWENEGNKRPHVFLLTIGNLAMRKARAGFSTNLFGCAGYKVTDNAGFSTVEEGVKDALKAEADIVVLCSSDEEYAEIAPLAATLLKKANPEVQVVVAGYPKEIVDSLKAAGVDEFIHVRTNVLDTLYVFQQKLGVML
ncbi:MAG: methylmalonyl-CoA mutase [Bacteroidetes bacterium]|nr:MAG: methylmalonyl-CoA mutase [Bacteroidota bacterium]